MADDLRNVQEIDLYLTACREEAGADVANTQLAGLFRSNAAATRGSDEVLGCRQHQLQGVEQGEHLCVILDDPLHAQVIATAQ